MMRSSYQPPSNLTIDRKNIKSENKILVLDEFASHKSSNDMSSSIINDIKKVL